MEVYYYFALFNITLYMGFVIAHDQINNVAHHELLENDKDG
mgnify:CR=1 FL=1